MASAPLQSPEAMASPVGPVGASTPELSLLQQAQAGMISHFDALSQEAVTALEDLVIECLREDKPGRREEVSNAAKIRFYCTQRQNTYYDEKDYVWYHLKASGQELPQRLGTYDITSPHKRSFVSILSENPPGVNFETDDFQSGSANNDARLAEKLRPKVDRLVKMKDRQAEAAGYFCTDGRCVGWTRIENGKLVISFYGVLESKVPIYTDDFTDDYCVLSKEVSLWKARADYPQYKDRIGTSDSTEFSYERVARLGILAKSRNGYTESLKSLTTQHNAWIHPSRFQKAPDVIQEELEQFFPDGVRVTLYSKVAVDAVPENMDALSVDFPVDGQGMSRPALLASTPDYQDGYNDATNLQLENMAKGIPARWVDTNAGVDMDAIAEQAAVSGAIHGIGVPAGKNISDCMTTEPAASLTAEAAQIPATMKQGAEYATGDFPALQGDATPGQDTVGVNKLLNNQAKGQLGPAWAGIQRFFASIYRRAIIITAPMFGPEYASLVEGKFSCHPDTDSSFPETTADKRAAFQAVMTQLGVIMPELPKTPDNLALLKKLSGLNDLDIPFEKARNRALRMIEQALVEPPIPPDLNTFYQQAAQTNPANQQALVGHGAASMNALMSGQQPPQAPQMVDQTGQPMQPPGPTTSIPFDSSWDYLQPMVDKIQDWLNSDECDEAMRQGKQAGVQNIKLLGAAMRQALQSQQPLPQVEPPKVTLSMEVQDPSTIAQFAQAAGARDTTAAEIQASQVPQLQKTAADTQNAAAGAQHKAVLAAKEAVEPVSHANVPEPPEPKKKGEK